MYRNTKEMLNSRTSIDSRQSQQEMYICIQFVLPVSGVVVNLANSVASH